MRRFFTKRRGKTGFTLIELLVTITIISVISITTGAIVISSMNTFRRQKDVMSAVDMKEFVCMTLKDHLRRRIEMGLVTENLATPTDLSIDAPVYGSTYKDGDNYYVKDSRLTKYHMIFSEAGRIYTVTSNSDGKYYVQNEIDFAAKKVYPASQSELIDGNLVDKKYCKQPFMAEELYEGYYVDLKFMPIYTNTQGRYRDIQVRVTIYDDATMTEEHQVAKGTETFHMLNIENRQVSIKFQNDAVTPGAPDEPAVISTQPELIKAPQPEGFMFCYFQ